ncbi:protein O-GlcNAcase isoform X1 [Parasteatoda tepidariorum]|uniref:protein O-GlcNAcase isoform X1 n=1 Tax=Parasteatoda tepidariorum TaxID=114398 RepID=UPI001C724BB6|nr:protein O-GlcNAcase isoform X1 [Parasteatoda tepidariorum]XP_042909995.1 protein O-GlcNAcase isoform X2 [Parasteatoda tepidariorum]
MADACDVAEPADDCKQNAKEFYCGVVEGFYGRPWTPEQRRDLFVKMKKLGLNTYMYAPKDDFKHRAYWREMYSVEEAEHLTSLVQAAEENDVIFFYALSPGLDITYSNPKEIQALKRKLEQVCQFGCRAFALLFDDIEPEISETDKEVYQSFAHAQVAVANEIFEYLSHPKFIFCPTEYCAARAIPNVQNSEYLNTIGQKLHIDIDIMWTGPKVISKDITVESIQELSEVLRRPPLIWDNLHANDYDQKRLFMGPYCGRSTELIPRLRGILTNPNCEYETNYIPIHTLSQWSKCTVDGKRELNLSESVCADIKLETENEFGSVEDIPSHLSPNTYHPANALRVAVQDWLPEFYKSKNALGRLLGSGPLVPTPIPACPLPVITACFTTSNMTTPNASGRTSPGLDSNFQPLSSELVNSLITTKEANLEPMDCNPLPPSPKSSPPVEVEVESEICVETTPKSDEVEATAKDDGAEEMQTEPIDVTGTSNGSETEDRQLTEKDVSLLIDLFYLPFEHGRQGLKILQEFHWLKSHGYLVCQNPKKKRNEPDNPEVQEWLNRATRFDALTQSVGKLLMRLTFCPNRSLLYDLYPYIWDIKGVISMLNSYLKWIALRRVPLPVTSFISAPFTWFSKGYKEAFMSGDQEPWSFLGGLTSELQHLLPLESVNDLFLYKSPETPNNRIYTIRPYLLTDESQVYDVCRKTCDDGLDGSEVFPEYPDLIGDKLVGHFLCLSPEYCFVVEDETGICGYALAALDARQLKQKCETAWIPTLQTKYPSPKKENGEMLTPAEEIIASFYNQQKDGPPDVVYLHHPSILRMNILPSVSDSSVPKRMLTCILSTLKANGSHGVFVDVTVGDKNIVDFFSKLGFLEIAHPGFHVEDVFYMGRTF